VWNSNAECRGEVVRMKRFDVVASATTNFNLGLNAAIEHVEMPGHVEFVEPDAPEAETGVVEDHIHQGQVNCLLLDVDGLVELVEHHYAE
jgi:hypothetical protein